MTSADAIWLRGLLVIVYGLNLKMYCNVFLCCVNLISMTFGILLLTPQVTVMRSYDAMVSSAQQHPEGTLVYLMDQTDLYVRVGAGFRQVMVEYEKGFCSIPWIKMYGLHTGNGELQDIFLSGQCGFTALPHCCAYSIQWHSLSLQCTDPVSLNAVLWFEYLTRPLSNLQNSLLSTSSWASTGQSTETRWVIFGAISDVLVSLC